MTEEKRPTRRELDQIAWRTLHAKPKVASAPLGYKRTGRAANYRELGEQLDAGADFEIAWGDFLHEFYAYKAPSFFAEPPPETMPPQYRALLAGVAEFLSQEFGLPVPDWISRPEFFLEKEWDIRSEVLGEEEIAQYAEERRARSHQAFLKRGVIFEPRSLIAL